MNLVVLSVLFLLMDWNPIQFYNSISESSVAFNASYSTYNIIYLSFPLFCTVCIAFRFTFLIAFFKISVSKETR